MKFGNSLREENVDNYGPGPGEYNPPSAVVVREPKKGSSSFLAPEYVNSLISKKTSEIGPGQYTPLIDVVKRQKRNENIMKRKSYSLRAEGGGKLIASIPNNSELYCESSSEQKTNIGPGNYNPTLNFIKPKVKGGLIFKASRTANDVGVKEEEIIPIFEEREIMREILLNKCKKLPNQSHFFQSKVSRARECIEPWTSNEYPPVGYYDVAGQFGKVMTNVNQNMALAPPRFPQFKSEKTYPGPGQYNLAPHSQAHIAISKEIKGIQWNSKGSELGPGSYNAKLNTQWYSKGNAEKKAVFGSSSKRFTHSKPNTTPGPCHYNTGIKRNRPPKQILFIEEPSTNVESDQISNQQEDQIEICIGFNLPRSSSVGVHSGNSRSKNEISKEKVKIKSSACFASKVGRYNQVDEASVGPGVYSLTNSLLKTSHNKLVNHFPQANRDTNLTQGRTNVGPGQYNAKVDFIKPKKYFALKFSS